MREAWRGPRVGWRSPVKLGADEDTAGWEELNAGLLLRFGVSRYAEIASPPFATNWTVLWTRL